MEYENALIPFGEAVSDARPNTLSWDRCDAGDNEYGEYCYYGVIYDPATDEVVYFTPAWSLKSLVGNSVVRWMEDNGYAYNEQSWEWNKA